MHSRRGFSLIEALVYTAILGVVSIFVVNSILLIIKSFNNYQLTNQASMAGEVAMERITREIRLANDIDKTNSVFNVNPGRLSLLTINPDTQAPTTIDFFISGSALMIKEGGDSPSILTPANVVLANLIFREVATSTNFVSKAVKIEMEIRSSRGNYQKSVKFYDTTVLRGSYR